MKFKAGDIITKKLSTKFKIGEDIKTWYINNIMTASLPETLVIINIEEHAYFVKPFDEKVYGAYAISTYNLITDIDRGYDLDISKMRNKKIESLNATE